jgi:general secretion pathway protein F
MAQRFSYVAVDAGGRTRSGAVTADTEAAARADLTRRKLLPVKIALEARAQKSPAPGEPALARAGRSAISHKQRLLFTRQLATLIEAAVPVDEALSMIAQQQDRPQVRRVCADVLAGVQEGQRLADALGRHPASFPGLYRAAVAGGERAGKLGFVLNRLSTYLAAAHALRAKITTALIYPAALVIVAVTVISALMIFVVPSLAEQFQSFDARLPLLTQIMIALSAFLTTFWPLIGLGLVGGVLGARALLARPGPRAAFDAWLLKAPLLGRWVVATNASRLVRALSMLAAAGIPVLEALRASREAVGNRAVAAAVDQMALAVEQGEPLSHAMHASRVIPPMAGFMAASGENAGELPAMLEKAAEHLDQEFEAFSASALSLLEPVIIVFMGGAVAAIVLAIMLPILQLNRMAIG